MSYAARADDVRRQEWSGPARFVHPGWIAAMILGFVFFWPIGLAILGYVIWSRKMGCYRDGGDRWQNKMQRMEAKMERLRARMGGGGGTPTSGNRAFDEYREETLRRLEDEQREFRDFLERLRFAKDKAEFDQFMADRRNRPSEPPAPYSPQQG